MMRARRVFLALVVCVGCGPAAGFSVLRRGPRASRRLARGVLSGKDEETQRVGEEETADFVRRLQLTELVDEEYAKATARVKELAALKQGEQVEEIGKAIDEMVAEVERSEMRALREMEDQVEFLVGRVKTQEAAVAAAVEDARRVADEAAAYERQARLFGVGSVAAAAALAAAAYYAAAAP